MVIPTRGRRSAASKSILEFPSEEDLEGTVTRITVINVQHLKPEEASGPAAIVVL